MKHGRPVAEEAWRLHLIIMALLLSITYMTAAYHYELPKLEEDNKALREIVQEKDEMLAYQRQTFFEELDSMESAYAEAYRGLTQQNEQLKSELAKLK